jgi:hypothetical protein
MPKVDIMHFKGWLRLNTLIAGGSSLWQLKLEMAMQSEQHNATLALFELPNTFDGKPNWQLIAEIEALIQSSNPNLE